MCRTLALALLRAAEQQQRSRRAPRAPRVAGALSRDPPPPSRPAQQTNHERTGHRHTQARARTRLQGVGEQPRPQPPPEEAPPPVRLDDAPRGAEIRQVGLGARLHAPQVEGAGEKQ